MVDVLVIGAGPTGCAAALAFEKRGAEVLLVESQPRAAARFAGEWLHPPGVRKLAHLGVDTDGLSRAKGLGFALYAEGEAPVELPYSRGTSIARYHHELVDDLRAQASLKARITYRPNTAFRGFQGNDVLLESGGSREVVSATRVIAADGRGSRVRAALGAPRESHPISYMMGIEMKNCRLPYEGLGHVFSGGPGPALFYRVNDSTIRGCLDVPMDLGPKGRSKEFVQQGFERVLPPSLREPFRAALSQATPWAGTRFQPRTFFGRDHVWLVGDAVGHVHPITGMGMTLGILDAAAAAECETLEEYQRARSSYVVELLTNSLYHVLVRDDESAGRVRHGLFEMLRRSPAERLRTMRILTGEDPHRSSFVAAFARASGHTLFEALPRLSALPFGQSVPTMTGALMEDLKWLKWPLSAAVSPLTGTHDLRSQSTFDQPLNRSVPLHSVKQNPTFRRVSERLLQELSGLSDRMSAVG